MTSPKTYSTGQRAAGGRPFAGLSESLDVDIFQDSLQVVGALVKQRGFLIGQGDHQFSGQSACSDNAQGA